MIFKKTKVQTSNDLYNAYKSELGKNEIEIEKKGFFSFTFLKLELMIVAAGLIFMQQNNLTLELKQTYIAENTLLPVTIQESNQLANVEFESEEEFKVAAIDIREDFNTEKTSDNKSYADSNNIDLLIKLLKSEVTKKVETDFQNRIIISQK